MLTRPSCMNAGADLRVEQERHLLGVARSRGPGPTRYRFELGSDVVQRPASRRASTRTRRCRRARTPDRSCGRARRSARRPAVAGELRGRCRPRRRAATDRGRSPRRPAPRRSPWCRRSSTRGRARRRCRPARPAHGPSALRMLPTLVTPPFASSGRVGELEIGAAREVVELQQRVAVRRARHERQRQRAARRHRRHRRRRDPSRSMRCHSLNTQKARVFVAGSNGCGQARVDRHRILEDRPGAVGDAARRGRDVLLHRARLLDVDGVERHELVAPAPRSCGAAPAARTTPFAPERRRKSLKPSGLWHPSSAQPRWSSFGITLSSKNVSPARLDQRAQRRVHLHLRRPVAQHLPGVVVARLEEHAARVADAARQRRQRAQQDLALLDRRIPSGRRTRPPGRS